MRPQPSNPSPRLSNEPLQAGQLQQPTLTLLWSAYSTKSAAVAAVTATLLSELLRSRHCPETLQESMLAEIHAACTAGVTEGLAALLNILSRSRGSRGARGEPRVASLQAPGSARQPRAAPRQLGRPRSLAEADVESHATNPGEPA